MKSKLGHIHMRHYNTVLAEGTVPALISKLTQITLLACVYVASGGVGRFCSRGHGSLPADGAVGRVSGGE